MSAEAVHYNMHDAKTHLSRIIERVERGEEIIIDRAGTPVARIVPLVRRVNRTAVGSLAGQVDLSGDWDSPQTNAEIAADLGLGERMLVAQMTLLLDTHIALWAITGDATLGQKFLRSAPPRPDIFPSPVSLWEITIKRAVATLAGPTDLAARCVTWASANCP